MHRIGRTGRAGASGDAISLYSAKDERLLADIEKLIKHKFVPAQLSGFMPKSHRGAERASAEPRQDRGADRRRPVENEPRAESRPHGQSPASRKEKVDPWFLKPYEPEQAAPAPAPTSTSSSSAPKQQKKAALLGGTPKR